MVCYLCGNKEAGEFKTGELRIVFNRAEITVEHKGKVVFHGDASYELTLHDLAHHIKDAYELGVEHGMTQNLPFAG